MAKITLKNLSELEKYVNKVAKQSLIEDVVPEVVSIMQEQIQETVYDVYTPVVYDRKGYDGGLIDADNIKVTEVENGVAIQNMRVDEETGKYIAYTVESGSGYDYEFPYANKPRPFTENTREELRKTGVHVEKLKQGLKKKGLDVK